MSNRQGDCSGSGDDGWWNGLPQDLQEEVLAWLPAESLAIDRSVCMEWKELFSSKEFLSGLWVKVPINRTPWILLLHPGHSQLCYAYCFYTQTWKLRFPLPFPITADNVYLGGSGGGRILVLMPDPRSRVSIFVWNPFTQTFAKLLPPLSIGEIRKCAISEGEATNNNNGAGIYNVVIMGSAADTNLTSVEIYDSSAKAWRIVGHVPSHLCIMNQLIFCEGYFYTMAVERGTGLIALTLVFSIQQELRTWKVPLPTLIERGVVNLYDLIRCGSQLLMVSYSLETRLCIIWKLRKNSLNSSFWWEDIDRMPASLENRIISGLHDGRNWKLGIIGVGDWVCLISHINTGVEILVYSLSEKSWNWLPTCPLHLDGHIPHHISYTHFQPTPA